MSELSRALQILQSLETPVDEKAVPAGPDVMDKLKVGDVVVDPSGAAVTKMFKDARLTITLNNKAASFMNDGTIRIVGKDSSGDREVDVTIDAAEWKAIVANKK